MGRSARKESARGEDVRGSSVGDFIGDLGQALVRGVGRRASRIVRVVLVRLTIVSRGWMEWRGGGRGGGRRGDPGWRFGGEEGNGEDEKKEKEDTHHVNAAVSRDGNDGLEGSEIYTCGLGNARFGSATESNLAL